MLPGNEKIDQCRIPADSSRLTSFCVFFRNPGVGLDNLDRIATACVLVLVGWALILVVQPASPQEKSSGQEVIVEAKVEKTPAWDDKVRLINDLFDAGNLDQAEEVIKKLISEFPQDGMPHLLLGDLFVRRQQPLDAMLHYQQAVDLNPDFLDKKTPLFQGKKIKATIDEAESVIGESLTRNPNDPNLKQSRKTLYYMKRRMAGGCG